MPPEHQKDEPEKMNVIVTDAGFGSDDWTHGFHSLEALPNPAITAVHLGSDTTVNDVLPHITDIALVRIHFPSFADGRGFSLARQLRLNGYTGRLRAHGHVIADQYAMARRSGFDEVEIDQLLARRQPETQWLDRAEWQSHNYQALLRTGITVKDSIDNR